MKNLSFFYYDKINETWLQLHLYFRISDNINNNTELNINFFLPFSTFFFCYYNRSFLHLAYKKKKNNRKLKKKKSTCLLSFVRNIIKTGKMKTWEKKQGNVILFDIILPIISYTDNNYIHYICHRYVFSNTPQEYLCKYL